MNAINNDDMLQRLDFGVIHVGYALAVLRDALVKEKDADLYGCTIGEAEQALSNAMADFEAAGIRIF